MILRARTDDLSWREVDDEVIILDLLSQRYLSLNFTGLTIWRRLQDDGATIEELANALTEEYTGIDAEVAEHDVRTFVALLRERNLLA